MKQKIPKNAKIPFIKVIKKKWRLLVMLFPAMLFVFIFSYIPMAGIILAFKKYQVAGGVFFSPWNGLRNFKTLFLTNKMWIATRNTFFYNLAFIFLGLIFEMGSAILLNEVLFSKFKKTVQSFMFLPYFISWVVAGAIMYNIFNYEKGIVNAVLKMAGMAPFDLYNTPGAWPFVLIFLKLWKQTGYGSIVYLAAITGLDQEMFEAASIDGANAWQRFWNVTIPSISPIIFYNVLTALITHLQVINPALALTDGGPGKKSMFMSYVIYLYAFKKNKLGYAAAYSVIFFILVGIFTAVLFKTQKEQIFGEGE